MFLVLIFFAEVASSILTQVERFITDARHYFSSFGTNLLTTRAQLTIPNSFIQQRPSLHSMLSLVLLCTTMVLISSVESLTRPFTKNKLQGVLFDIDGTLVNSDPIHHAVFQELLLKEDGFNDNKPIDEAFFRKWISGRVNAVIAADFFPEWSIDQREAWSAQKEARFREVAQASMSKMAGLDRFRNWITENGLRKAAVTNAPRLNAEAILSGIGYDTWFENAVIIGDECEKPKPDPCPYLTACKLLGVEAQQCIVVEDSPSGARAGVAAGAFVIGILSGQDRVTLENAGCHLIVKDFEDPVLWRYLESLSTIDSSIS